MSEELFGWLAVSGSILCFGSFGVPIKSPKVVAAKVDPVIFQCYKTFWVFVTSFVVLTYNPFSWTPLGILSGLSWVPASIAAILAVNCIGLGIAQGIWSGIIIMVSFSWGAFVFHEPLKSLPLSILGVFLLSVGIVGMAVSRLTFWLEHFPLCGVKPSYIEITNVVMEDLKLLQEKKIVEEDVSFHCGCCTLNRSVIGYAAAIFNGVWGGSVMVPLKLAQQSASTSGIEYVFSFAVGAVIVNFLILVVYFIYKKIVLGKPLPSFHLQVMVIPGGIAGILWSIGNYLSIYGVLFLGEAVGYPSVQACLIVSGLWGIFYYKELQSTQIVVWFLSAGVSLGGIVLLSQMK